MSKKEHYQIIFTSIILTIAISLAFAYFIGGPMTEASHGFFCFILGANC